MKTLSDRMKFLLQQKGINQAELSRKTGIPTATINRYIKGERKGKDNPLATIGKFLGVDEHWLLTGKGSMQRNDQTQTENFIEVPMISGHIAAGGGLEPNNTIEIKISFRRDWISRRGNPKNMSIIRVKGDSMEPTLYSGDVLLIDHDKKHIDTYGGIYAISVNNEIMIKRVELNHKTRIVRVISDNNKYSVQEFEEKEVTVNGKLIWFGREYEK